ncbi:MAG TPA: IS66 family insertion sequence element accessory protein TnpB, partial [Epulopiscium sp.]|nr:IS66 family insertion sequence element accessory protein TnpB [Candidatus Epulonipiscium sp.]
LACGPTDFRKAIDGLVAIVSTHFKLDPFSPSVFLFCNRKKDKLKALIWDDNGFVLVYKRLEQGKFQWPKTASEARLISRRELRWLLEGLSLDQPKVLPKITVSDVC